MAKKEELNLMKIPEKFIMIYVNDEGTPIVTQLGFGRDEGIRYLAEAIQYFLEENGLGMDDTKDEHEENCMYG